MERSRLIAIVLILVGAARLIHAQESVMALPLPPLPAGSAPSPPSEAPTRLALGLADLERIALEKNPTIAQANAKLQEARARAFQAGLHPNPILAYDSGSLGAEGTAGVHGAFMDHPIVTNGKLRVNRARFEVEVEQGQWRLIHQRFRLINGVRLRYFRILALQRGIELHREMVADAVRLVELTEKLVEAEHAEEPALLRARNHWNQARLALATVEILYQQTWSELVAFLGRPELPTVPLAGDLEHPCPVPSFVACLDRLYNENPELHAVRLWVRRTQTTLDYEQRFPFPDWIIRVGTEYDHTINQNVPMFRFTTQFPLWDRNQGNIEMTRQNLRDQQLNIERYQLELRLRLAKVYYPYLTALETAREYRENILPTARQAFEEYLELFLEEEESYSRVEGTETALYEASFRYIDALLEAREAEVRIHGLLIEDTLAEPLGTPTGARPTRVPVSP